MNGERQMTPEEIQQQMMLMAAMKPTLVGPVSFRFCFLLVMGTLVLMLGTLWMYNVFTAWSINTRVVEPKPGLTCVVASATGSVAISCNFPDNDLENQNGKIK